MKRAALFMLCLCALVTLSLANDSLNVRTVGSWPYYSCIAVATGHAAGHHVALIHCRGGVMMVNVDDPTAPTWFGEVAINDSCKNILWRPRDIHIQDTLAYLSLGKSGFTIINFSDPAHPAMQSQVTPPGEIVKIEAYGNYIYAADDSFGLRVYDATDLSTPVQVNMIASNKGCWGVGRKDTFLFISVNASASNSWIISLNISDPANPVIIDSLGGSFSASPIIVDSQYLYATGFAPIVDISDPHNLTIRSNTFMGGSNGKMAIVDTVLYTPNMAGFSGYLFYNVANPDAVYLARTYPSRFYARDVCLEGQLLFLADETGGMQIVNVSDPANPVEIGHYNTPQIYGKGMIDAGYGFFPDDGMHVIDLSDSSRLNQTGFCLSRTAFVEITARDTFAFVSEFQMGLRIFNISDRNNPILVDTLPLPKNLGGLSVRDTFVYYAADTVYIINVARIDSPFVAGKFTTPGSAGDVTVIDSIAYVMDGSAGLRIVNVKNPANPIELGFYDTPGLVCDVAIRDSFAYVADGNSGLRVINVANPVNPVEVGYWSLGFSSYGGAQAVVLDGNLAYVAYDTFGMRVVNIADPVHPTEVGHYKRATFKGAFTNDAKATGVSLWNSNAYVSYLAYGLQVFHYYGPTGVNGVTNDKLRITSSLSPNRPNPFTANTTIHYQLSAASTVTLIVYNVMGQQVRTLVSGLQQAGAHDVHWNGRNDGGKQLSAGVYFCRMETTDRTMTTKMVKIK